MAKVTSLWRWCFVAGAVLLAFALVFGRLDAAVLAGVAFAAGAVLCRLATGRWPTAFLGRWWDGVRREVQILYARALKALDKAPSYWAHGPQDEDHAALRRDYENLVARAASREDFFLLAELAYDLRRRGDNPLAKPPTIRTQVQGLMGAQGFLGSIAGGWQVWAIAAAICLSGWGVAAVQGALKERIEDQRDDARADVRMAERALANEREIRARLVEEVRAADLLSQQTAANLEAERSRNRASAARERRRQSALRQVDAGGPPPDWERSLRDDDPVAGPDPGTGGAAPTRDSR